MPDERSGKVRRLWQQEARPRLGRAGVRLRAGAQNLWQLLRPPLSFALQVAAALILLFEEWGWQPLAAALARMARFPLWARLELAIAGLPPYGALAALALPTSILLPLKFVSLYLLAAGQVLAATLLFVAAKIASTALIARIFLLTKPALMQIGWFATIYNLVVPWQQALFARIRASWVWRWGRVLKARLRRAAAAAWARWRPALAAALAALRARLSAAWGRLRPGLEEGALRLRLALRRALGRA